MDEIDTCIRSARSINPNDVQLLEDFSKRTLDKRKEKIPELIAACKSGKRAFLGNGQDHHCQQYKTTLRDYGKVNEHFTNSSKA